MKSSCRVIEATCSSLAAGFQVIVQLLSEAQKLYVNQSMDPHTPVTVEVERDGLYQVTIFPIREGRGILDSDTEHLVFGTNYPTTTTTTTTTTVETVSSTPNTITTPPAEFYLRIITGKLSCLLLLSHVHRICYGMPAGLGSALGIVTTALIVVLGVVAVLCCKLKSTISKSTSIKCVMKV